MDGKLDRWKRGKWLPDGQRSDSEDPRIRTSLTDLNRIRTEQGKCTSLLHEWKMLDTLLCEYGQVQTIKHIEIICSITKYEGGIKGLHIGDSEAQDWLV